MLGYTWTLDTVAEMCGCVIEISWGWLMCDGIGDLRDRDREREIQRGREKNQTGEMKDCSLIYLHSLCDGCPSIMPKHTHALIQRDPQCNYYDYGRLYWASVQNTV